MTFVFSSAGYTYSANKAVVVVDIVALNMGESPMVMASEALSKHVVDMVKGCLLSLYFLSLLAF